MDLASPQYKNSIRTLWLAGGWALLFIAAVVAYWPGLKGPFVLDDYGTVAALGQYGGVTDWQSFKAFVLGGNSGPTGRPVSLITFLIDANNWPADPAPFKRTNLVIHLLTAALLGVLVKQILCLLQFGSRDARNLALASAACWVLHPFLASTTLYVVQRMAQLATLFVLAGLIAYLHGRSFLQTNRRKAYVLMSLSVPLFTVLAMLSKENGVLLPILIGVVEITVIASQRGRLVSVSPYWTGLFIGAPVLVIGFYLGKQFFRSDFFEIITPRDFSLYERLLTEPRVLADYLQNWFIPKLYTTGVYQDHILKSTGLLSPLTTLLAIAFHAAVVGVSLFYRRKWPLFALAALFFYGSHLIESTVFNLELYFEHRNYLSACFLFVPLVVVLHQHVRRRVFIAVLLGALLILAGFTRYSATVWASLPSIVEASARKAPLSARAQAEHANILFNANRHDEALRVLESAIENIPQGNTVLRLNRLIFLCSLNRLEKEDFQNSLAGLTNIPFDSRLLSAYSNLANVVKEKRCPNHSVDLLTPMFESMLDVPENSDPATMEYSHIQFLIGYVYTHSGEPQKALLAFERSLRARPGASHAMAMAAQMASSDYPVEALRLSALALTQLALEKETMVIGDRVIEADIREFRATVQADLENSQATDTDGPSP